MKNSNHISHGYQTTLQKNTGLTMPAALPKIFVTRMLIHDLFATANAFLFCCSAIHTASRCF